MMMTGRRFATCEVVHGSAACRLHLVLVLICLISLSCLSSAIRLPPPRENAARNQKVILTDKFLELTANGADETNKSPKLATNQNAPISGNTGDSDSSNRATVSTETASHDVEAPSHHDHPSIPIPTATVELNSEKAPLDSNVSPPPSRASTAADFNRNEESFNRNASPTPTSSSFMPTPTATADLNRDEALLNHDVSSPPSPVFTAVDLNGDQASLNDNASPTPATSSDSFSLDKTEVPSKRASRSSSRRHRLSPRRRSSVNSDLLANQWPSERMSTAIKKLSSMARSQVMNRFSHLSLAARRLPVSERSQREPRKASAFAFGGSEAGTSSSASPSPSNALNRGNSASFLVQTRSADTPATATTTNSAIKNSAATFQVEDRSASNAHTKDHSASNRHIKEHSAFNSHAEERRG